MRAVKIAILLSIKFQSKSRQTATHRMIETTATREIALLGVERVGLGAKATGGASVSTREVLAEDWDDQGSEDQLGAPT